MPPAIWRRLAHLSAVLLGIGEVRVNGRRLPAADGLRHAGLEPFKLRPKEGLALINGTQVSTALALAGLFGAEDVLGGGDRRRRHVGRCTERRAMHRSMIGFIRLAANRGKSPWRANFAS